MRLLLVRHGIAVEPGTSGILDDERPLTKRGEKRFRRAARGLVRLCARPDALLTSPLLRAYETARILAAAWGRIAPKKTPALAGGSLQDLISALAKYPLESRIVLVGHEPHLSTLLGAFLGGAQAERVAFRKGGVALLEFEGALTDGGRLVFALPPRALLLLAKD
jgi:phosphohistidine phosphatase